MASLLETVFCINSETDVLPVYCCCPCLQYIKAQKRVKNQQLLVTFLCILIWFQKAGSHVCFKEKKLLTYIFKLCHPLPFHFLNICMHPGVGVGVCVCVCGGRGVCVVDAIFTFLLWTGILEYHALLL